MHALIYQYLSEIADERQAVKMAAYMKNQFVFLGVSAPQRKKISSVFFREMKRSMINFSHTAECISGVPYLSRLKRDDKNISPLVGELKIIRMKKTALCDWHFVQQCYDCDFREMQYVAIDYLREIKKVLTKDDLPKIKKLIITKSWWDTVDALHVVVGDLALRFPSIRLTLLKWSTHENLWLRRIAINHQLLRKEKTDTVLLEKIIHNNTGSKEFFINKAIGWALRDYSKTNPDWVYNFIENNRSTLAPLSIKEGSKYL